MDLRTKDGFQTAILIAFHALIILTPLLWTATTSELFEFPKMMFVYATTVIITALWLVRMAATRTLIIKRTFLDIPILLFFLSQLLSTIFSIDPHTGIFGYYSRFHGGLLSTVSYTFLFYALVSNLTKRHVKGLIISLLLVVGIGALYAFPEHFGHSPSCAMITGEFNVTCWVQDVQDRVFGTFGQPNWLAAFIITVFFIPLSRVFKKYTAKEYSYPTALYIALLALLFSVLLFTKSRSGLLGLGFGGLTFFALLIITHQEKLKQILIFILITAIAGLVIFIPFGRSLIPQFESAFSRVAQSKTPGSTQTAPADAPTGQTQLQVGGTESSEIRSIVWSGAWELFKQHPILGSGNETFAYAYYNTRPVEHNLVSEWDFLYNKAHNEFLDILATTGLVGIFTYLILLLAIGIMLIKYAWQDVEHKPFYAAVLGGLIALSVSNFFGFSTVPVGLLLYLLPAMAIGLHSDPPDPQTIKYAPTLYITASILIIITLYLLAQIAALYQADKKYAVGKNYLQTGNIVKSIQNLERAVELNPNEPTFTDQLSLATAQAAVLVHQSGESTQAAQLAQQAQGISDLTLQMNPVHLNFYKTRARVFLYLSQVNPAYLDQALDTLMKASELAPTDAKILYNIALLHEQSGRPQEAENYYRRSIDLKPNYEAARYSYGQLLEKLDRFSEAAEQYTSILTTINPDNPQVIQALDRLATQSGEFE